jgi:uncharacterized protein YcgL (UPF0745 family)
LFVFLSFFVAFVDLGVADRLLYSPLEALLHVMKKKGFFLDVSVVPECDDLLKRVSSRFLLSST